MKRMKIFGIGATTLLVLIAMAPLTYSEFDQTDPVESDVEVSLVQTQIVGIDLDAVWAELLAILEDHEEDLELIAVYLDNMGCGDGGASFPLPDDLQAIFDGITSEIVVFAEDYYEQSQQFLLVQLPLQQGQPPLGTFGGGITKAQGPYPWINFCEFGIYWDVWMDDGLTVAVCAGSITPATLLGAYGGPAGVILAIVIGTYAFLLANANNGNGVEFDLVFRYFPYPGAFLLNIQPQ